MTISVNYQKRKNNILFNKFQTNKSINLTNIQNYIPIYNRFFSLNTTNWNSINLNHKWAISDVKDSKIKDIDENIFICKLKNISDDSDDFTITQKVFIKMAPLLDPFKYIVGKYNHNDPLLFTLPSIDSSIKVHPKFTETNNSSFVDGFFSFLTSQLLNEHNFIHGVDYYGSFLAIKNEYKINIIDDIDYLAQSDFFNSQKNILFSVEDYSHLIATDNIKPLQPLKISTSIKSNISIKSLDDSIFENIFESSLSLNDVKNNGIDLVDITNSTEFDLINLNKSKTLKSDSSCSSRTSYTNDADLEEEDVEMEYNKNVSPNQLTNSDTENNGDNDNDDVWEDIDDDSNEGGVDEES